MSDAQRLAANELMIAALELRVAQLEARAEYSTLQSFASQPLFGAPPTRQARRYANDAHAAFIADVEAALAAEEEEASSGDQGAVELSKPSAVEPAEETWTLVKSKDKRKPRAERRL